MVIWALGAVGALPIAWSLGSVGIVTFLGVLLLAFQVKKVFDKNEVQLAITASVLAVYFALAPVLIFVGISPIDPDLANTIIGHFTTVVEVVVAFYMGSTTIGYSMKAWAITKVPKNEQADLVKGL